MKTYRGGTEEPEKCEEQIKSTAEGGCATHFFRPESAELAALANAVPRNVQSSFPHGHTNSVARLHGVVKREWDGLLAESQVGTPGPQFEMVGGVFSRVRVFADNGRTIDRFG